MKWVVYEIPQKSRRWGKISDFVVANFSCRPLPIPITTAQLFAYPAQNVAGPCHHNPTPPNTNPNHPKYGEKHMILANETGQQVYYWIQTASSADCGAIDVDGIADLPGYDNQTNVYVGFKPILPQQSFTINCADTGKGERVELALIVAGGK